MPNGIRDENVKKREDNDRTISFHHDREESKSSGWLTRRQQAVGYNL